MGRNSFSLLAITLDITLYMTLQSAIGLNLSGVMVISSLGISAMKVELREGRSQCWVRDSPTTFQTSSFIRSQKEWKNVVVKPSGPGALPSLSCCIAVSTSCCMIGRRRSSLCSAVMILGTLVMILFMARVLSSWGSWWTCWKCLRNSYSISSWFSNLSPSGFWTNEMVLCILHCIVVRWKNLVLLSPSFSHLILDFCLHRISSCFLRSSNWLWMHSSWARVFSLCPSEMICCWSSAISLFKLCWAWKMFPIVAAIKNFSRTLLRRFLGRWLSPSSLVVLWVLFATSSLRAVPLLLGSMVT